MEKFSYETIAKFLLSWAILGSTFSIAAQGHSMDRGWKEESLKDTARRIKDHGYPAETHRIETEDNYLLTMFRIPYSPKLQNQNVKKPAVLIQHGLLSSSDAWILSGPNDAMPFLLCDAGYDVFLGNARGNRYSRNNTRLSPNHPYFWRFSWHEIGMYDMSAMIDTILHMTNQTKIHYVGHSQGTTVLMVLMSMRPEYNAKIKTAHLLAPIAFMSNMSSALAKYTRPFFGRPSKLSRLFDTQEILPSTLFYVQVYEQICKYHRALEYLCKNMYFFLNGAEDLTNMNMTVAEHTNETLPAGASSNQALHYLQEYESGRFRQFDYGERKNMKVYGRLTPPDYDVRQITAAVHLYYSDNDSVASVKDVEYLRSLLPNVIGSYFVPLVNFTHADFLWSIQVKETINERVIAYCDAYEMNTGFLTI